MAKMYYTEEEAAAALGISVDELNAYVSDGRLKSYQDGARRMFKAGDVDALTGGEEEMELELAPAADTGVEDAVSLAEADASQPATKEDTVITAEGISIFDDEDLEIEQADPLAKTQIAPSLEDQIAMEGVGSGSGLLDLTRESDDTSLGAEVLDHIDMDEAVPEADVLPAPAPMAAAPAAVVVEAPAYVESADPSAGAFTGILVALSLLALLLGIVMLSAMRHQVPDFLASLKENVMIVLGGGAVAIAIFAVVGYLVGKPSSRPMR
jgi:excisionase family DNA binding protein